MTTKQDYLDLLKAVGTFPSNTPDFSENALIAISMCSVLQMRVKELEDRLTALQKKVNKLSTDDDESSDHEIINLF